MSSSPSAIIYNSTSAAMQHEALGYHNAKRVVIPNGFDCSVFRPDEKARREVRTELNIAPVKVLVGLVARYHPMKNHLGFLAAAAQVARMHPSVCFLLVGPGVSADQAALSQAIAAQGLQDRVILLGERRDIARLTAAFDVACSASAWGEGFSNAVGEAMACGVPCVVTDVGDSAHVVGDTGRLIPPADPAALARAIMDLIEVGPERRRQLGMAARRRVESEFPLPSVAGRYEELYLAFAARAGTWSRPEQRFV